MNLLVIMYPSLRYLIRLVIVHCHRVDDEVRDELGDAGHILQAEGPEQSEKTNPGL